MDKNTSFYDMYNDIKPILHAIVEWFEIYYWTELRNDEKVSKLISKLQNDDLDINDRMNIVHNIVSICMNKIHTDMDKS